MWLTPPLIFPAIKCKPTCFRHDKIPAQFKSIVSLCKKMLVKHKNISSSVNSVGCLRKPIPCMLKPLVQVYKPFSSSVLFACYAPFSMFLYSFYRPLDTSVSNINSVSISIATFPHAYQKFALLMLWLNLFFPHLQPICTV